MPRLPLRPLLAALVVAGSLAACEPTCKQTCRRLLECEGVDTPQFPLDECTSACDAQQKQYEHWDDPALLDAFADYKRCVRDEACEAVADGVCYDEDVFAW